MSDRVPVTVICPKTDVPFWEEEYGGAETEELGCGCCWLLHFAEVSSGGGSAREVAAARQMVFAGSYTGYWSEWGPGVFVSDGEEYLELEAAVDGTPVVAVSRDDGVEAAQLRTALRYWQLIDRLESEGRLHHD